MAQARPAEIGASNDSSSMLDAPLEVGNRRDPRNRFDAKWTRRPSNCFTSRVSVLGWRAPLEQIDEKPAKMPICAPLHDQRS
jgi:hypothetical protein